MSNDKNQIQEKLRKWANETVIAYHKIASRDDVNIAYYTQSDLSLLSEKPELMIVGINPGNPYGVTPYTEQCKNKNWSYLHNNPLDKNHLLKGNYCKVEGKPSWEKHEKWRYWAGLKKCLSRTTLSTVIDDDSKIIVTNASFFSTKKADGISESLLRETIPFTLNLIHITTPNIIIFLSGKKCFDRLYRLSNYSKLFQFKYKHICGNIYVGVLNGKYCIGIPHPAYKTSEELNLVASILPFLLNVTDYDDIDDELILRECAKQIEEYEDRIYNKKKSNNTLVKKGETSNKQYITERFKLFHDIIDPNEADSCNLSYGGKLLNYEFYTKKDSKGKHIKTPDRIAVDLLIDGNDYVIRVGTRRNDPQIIRKMANAFDDRFTPGDTELTGAHWHVHAKFAQETPDDKIIEDMNDLLMRIYYYRNGKLSSK